ncbi:MAG: acyl-ACP--UDP-N-acetylglucosamine O-acyltransferase [Cyanobacteria bacterium REEB65]|nr:acyl-ACP--UDP-N-acetylglucosamine O-acyltransferase [Cyanobacteria bacterium REEB65]
MRGSTSVIEIHPTAVVHPAAKLGMGVKIGPYAVIAEHVTIGDETEIGPHVVVDSFTTLGRNCKIAPGAVIGAPPQDLKFAGEESYLVVGDRNVIRECATLNRATGLGETTLIGDDNLLMAYVHVAHNCIVGNHTVLSNAATLGGHVVVEDHARIGGVTALHQFIRIGKMAMVGGMSRLTQDVPPFMLAEGIPPKVYGTNVVLLQRHDVSADIRLNLKRAYKLLYRSGLNVSQALERIGELAPSAELAHLVDFVRQSARGLIGLAGRAEVPGDEDDDE